MQTARQKTAGVTLLEVMLVLVIATSLLVMLLNYTTQKSDELRRDKTVLQMQQILNAGMSFYVSYSFWPLKGADITKTLCGTWTDISALQAKNYISPTLTNSAYGNSYSISCNPSPDSSVLFVKTTVDTAANASVIAGRLPMAYRTKAASTAVPPASCTTGTDCTVVVSSVNIPGQNLNNARSVNFANVYYSGSCVPAPKCPSPNMKPSIIVAPASVSGINNPPTKCTDVNDPTTCTGVMVNPISSFTAFARGDASGNPVDPVTPGPLNCAMTAAEVCLVKNGVVLPSDGTLYWRICLSVATDKGQISAMVLNQGKIMGSIVAITRCVPNNGQENPSGSLDVYEP